MIDAIENRFTWVTGSLVAAALVATLAIPVLRKPEKPPICSGNRTWDGCDCVVSPEARLAERLRMQAQLAVLEAQLHELDKRVDDAVREVERKQFEADRIANLSLVAATPGIEATIGRLEEVDNTIDFVMRGFPDSPAECERLADALPTSYAEKHRLTATIERAAREQPGIPTRVRRLARQLVMVDSEIDDLVNEACSTPTPAVRRLQTEQRHLRDTRDDIFRAIKDPAVEVYWHPGTKP